MPSRRPKRSRAPDIDVTATRLDPATLGKTASRDPSARSPWRWRRSVKGRSGRYLAHSVSATITSNHAGTMATRSRRVRVRELRLHRTVTGRLRRCPTEPPRGRGARVGRRAVTKVRWGYLIPVRTRATVARERSGGALGGLGEARRILVALNATRGGKGLMAIRMSPIAIRYIVSGGRRPNRSAIGTMARHRH